MGTKLFHADGETYMPKLIVAFRNFTNASKNNIKIHVTETGCELDAETQQRDQWQTF